MTVWRPYARQAAWVFLCAVFACATAAVPAAARSKPGPVDERGVVGGVGAAGFTLATTHHGSLTVVTTPDTSVTMSGRHAVVRSGDHVGVRGFESHGSIRAIWVHIYSHAPVKPFSIRGTVTVVTSGHITVRSSGKPQVIAVGTGTPVKLVRRKVTLADVRPGDRVLVRVRRRGRLLVAVGIHVYARPEQHVSLSGTVVSVAGAAVTVKTVTGQQTVHIPPSAVIYLGASRTSLSTIRPGQSVRIYACCTGAPLFATSIHIRRTTRHVVSTFLHGTIRSLAARSISILVAGRTVVVATNPNTRYLIASLPARSSQLRIGDEVTIRVHKLQTGFLAVRIEVPVASRTPHTITGTVVSRSGSTISVLARGRRYILDFSGHPSVTVGGAPVGVGALRVGDRVHVTGLLRGTTLFVTALSASRPVPAIKTVRGTIVSVRGQELVIVDGAGAHHTVWIPRNVRPTVAGEPDSRALFPGARVTVRGTVSGSTIQARSLTVSVETRDVTGRLLGVAGGTVQVEARGRPVIVDLGGAPSAVDSGKQVPSRALHVGAFIEVHGYAATGEPLRAISIRVLHPLLDLRGTLFIAASGYTVRLTNGDRFRLHLSSGTHVVNELKPLPLTVDDIPAGSAIHVTGRARSDGSLSATSVVARLSSVTLRGTIAGITGATVSVSAGTSTESVRVDGGTPITQGSQPLQLSDVVVGDDVTVEGYQGRIAVLARAILVHRPLVGITGVVQATGSGGLTLSTSSATVRVIVTATTIVTGSVAIGQSVHVTGYRRGDGVILATRLHVGK